MKIRKTPFISFLIFMLVGLHLELASAQSIVLEGKVYDQATKEALIGANVFLTGTAIGAASDVDGAFRLLNVPPGTYDLRTSYLGYRNQTIKVQVASGQTKHLDIYLVAEALVGDTVLVLAQARGQTQAINQQLSGSAITNIVSADKIQALPDANAAEAVGRLPGISILRSGGEASQIVVRGLAPTYNRIEIAGVEVPSTDLNDRSVDLSMITPGVLSGIAVSKTLTPDEDADAIGGAVNLQLAQASHGDVTHKVNFQYGYNGLRQQLGQYKGDLSFSERFFDQKLGLLVTGNLERVQRGSDQFNASYSVLREKNPGETYAPVTTSGLTLNYSTNPRQRYGASVVLDYEYDAGKVQFANFLSRMTNDQVQFVSNYAPMSNAHYYDFDETLSSILVYSDMLQGEHHLPWADLKWGLANSTSSNNQPDDNDVEFVELNAFNVANLPTQANPQDVINFANNNFLQSHIYNGTSTRSRSFQENLTSHVDLQVPLNVLPLVSATLQLGGKYKSDYRTVTYNTFTGRMDLDPRVTAAAARNYSFSGNLNSTFVRTLSGLASMTNYIDKNFDPHGFLNGEYQSGPGLIGGELNRFFQNFLFDSLYTNATSAMLKNYNVHENIAAGYVMARINYGDLLMLLPGIRYENVSYNNKGERGIAAQSFTEATLTNPQIKDSTTHRQYGEWFPMVNAKIKPFDWFDIRLAHTRTYSRPQFSYIVPRERILSSALAVEFGDPDLKQQTSQNFDLFLSAHKNQYGLLTVGLFYKKIDDLIFQRNGHVILNAAQEGYPQNLQGFSLTIPENDPNKTIVKGIEVDVQSNLMWLPAPFSGLVFEFNYTHISSSTQYPISFVSQEILPVFPYVVTKVLDTARAGEMPDQPRDVANLSIGYDQGPFSGRVSMLYQGSTLSSIGVRPELDIFTSSLVRWDISLKYRLTEGLSLFWNMENIFNRPDQAYQEQSRYPTNIAYYGMTGEVGLQFQF